MHDQSMRQTNLQVRIPNDVDFEITQLAPKSKSAFVRQAIEEKIRRERFRQLEQKWIEALGKNSEDVKETRRWLKTEEWGPR